MKKRLFIAIGLPETLIFELEQFQKRLKPYARDAKWVKVAGIHLTLKFLGYVDPDQIPGIEERLHEVSTKFPAVRVQAKGCGFFPNARRPNVLWAGVHAPDLLPLQAAVENATEKLGFEKENRAYSPHLTIARFKDSRGLLPLTRETEKVADTIFGEFIARHFTLYESILLRSGAEYQQLRTFPLDAARDADQ